MPCNIGYKEVARVVIPKPVAKKFKAKVDVPKIDQELLNKIGEEDQAFVDWINELDISPLLNEALKRAMASVVSVGSVKVTINVDGSLEIGGSYSNDDGKRKLENYTDKISSRFQMEVLGIVAELLEYKVEISQNGDELVLEGEKHQHSHGQVNRYLKIVKDKSGNGEFRFEHFASPEELKSEKQKFLALAQKLGIKLHLDMTEKSGQPITNGTIHEHFLKNRN